MAKSVVVKRKKRGQPAAGRDRFVGTRLPEPLLARISKWTEKNDATSRSEAIRRLVQIGLQFDAQEQPFKASSRARAKELAGAQIDKMGDASATHEEPTERKQRLTRGPSEFREKRVDQPRKRPR